MIDNPNCPDRTGENNPAYGRHWYNNGIETIYCYENEVPEGYVQGSLHNTNNGRKFYTNGLKNIMLYEYEKVPCGFKPGKTVFKVKTEEEKIQLCSRRSKDAIDKHRHWYNNGSISKLFGIADIIPEGFCLGRIIKENK